MTSSEDLRAQLQALHQLTKQTPLFNPVFQLSLDVSREIEGGTLDLKAISGLISDLECEAMQSRGPSIAVAMGPGSAVQRYAPHRVRDTRPVLYFFAIPSESITLRSDSVTSTTNFL